jgi:hypothetical protein
VSATIVGRGAFLFLDFFKAKMRLRPWDGQVVGMPLGTNLYVLRWTGG